MSMATGMSRMIGTMDVAGAVMEISTALLQQLTLQ